MAVLTFEQYNELITEKVKFFSRKGYTGKTNSGKEFAFKHENLDDTVTHNRMQKQNPHLSQDEAKEAARAVRQHMKKFSAGEE